MHENHALRIFENRPRCEGNRWCETLARLFSRSEISLYIYWHVSVYSAFHRHVSLTLDVDSCLMISFSRVAKNKKKKEREKRKEKSDALQSPPSPNKSDDEHFKHTLSDAPLVSVPKKKLKGNYDRECPRLIAIEQRNLTRLILVILYNCFFFRLFVFFYL